MKFSPVSYHFIPLRPKSSPQHPVLKYLALISESSCIPTKSNLQSILPFPFFKCYQQTCPYKFVTFHVPFTKMYRYIPTWVQLGQKQRSLYIQTYCSCASGGISTGTSNVTYRSCITVWKWTLKSA
jgi:hypothetical protein